MVITDVVSLDILGLSQDHDDEEKSDRLAALVIESAVNQDSAKYTLGQIYDVISKSGSAALLDPLNMIHPLLSTRDPAAREMITLIGDYSSAKEVIIAVQESVERIETSLSAESDEDEEQKEERSLVDQLDILISLYSSAIRRLNLRKKKASETIRPLLSDLETTLSLVPQQTLPAEGRKLISSVSSAIHDILEWAIISTHDNEEEIVLCKMILHSLLETTITASIHCIKSSLAQKAFEAFFPKMVFRTVLRPGREESDKAMQDATQASIALGYDPSTLASRPKLASLIFLAHNPVGLPSPVPWLSSFLPTVLTSIQTNVALDETLFILFHQLTRATDLPQEILFPLAEVLPSLASIHPDPPTRFLAYRLLAILLNLASSSIHFEILRSLTSESEFPQMRTAAIGLVKEAVLDAISEVSLARVSNPFASPDFMKIFSPILFRPSPLDLFSSNLSLAEFQGSSEASRLAESLGLLYILIRRDTENFTGIHDEASSETINKMLLRPLRSYLAFIQSIHGSGDQCDEMALAALEMNLERVDSVLA